MVCGLMPSCQDEGGLGRSQLSHSGLNSKGLQRGEVRALSPPHPLLHVTHRLCAAEDKASLGK